ncbi:MAG: LysR family transcriptional regulator [Acutalibacteraceae bacterium]
MKKGGIRWNYRNSSVLWRWRTNSALPRPPRSSISRCPLSPTIFKRLEEQMGVQLLVRDRHSVRLTPAGHLFYPVARDILSKLDAVTTADRPGTGF